MSSYLQLLVVSRCRELGDTKAAEFFEVGTELIRQWVNGSKKPSLAAVEKVFSAPEGVGVDAGWAGKEVFIAAPFHKSTNPMTLFSLLAVWDRPKFGYRHRFGDAFIVHARNQLADDFLQSGMPWCWWIDDDMVCPAGNASWYLQNSKIPMPDRFAGLHTPNQLMSRGKTLIGGLYFGRYEHGKPMYAEGMLTAAGEEKARHAPLDEVAETDWVGFGCVMHRREVLLDIRKAYPHLEPQHPKETFHFFSASSDAIVRSFRETQQKATAIVALVREGKAAEAEAGLSDLLAQMSAAEKEYLKESRLQQGEDQTFCRRARKAGHPAHIDFSIVCGHLGTLVYGPHNTGRR
jgi:hypothetical protein